ncbi:MAG: DnaD domain protein [Clostridiales Family XIII bacterium]|jgi:DnaD/phage-associated family protein|nr:DnaD domain protein [Clostridiales Family XIII bacterium]
MSYIIENHLNYYLDDTQIPNVFIAEYLPGAPGDCVKVYLYAYMRAARKDVLSIETLAKALDLAPEDVLAAWTYFEDKGLIRKRYPDASDSLHYDVIFTDLKGLVFGASDKENDEPGEGEKLRSALEDEVVRAMYRDIEQLTGKPFGGADIPRIGALLDEGAPPELVTFAYKYCGERRKNVRAPYVAEVVRRWIEAGVKTPEDAEAHVWDIDVRMDQYRQIMKSLGLHISSITDAEKQVFNNWLDDMGFTMDEILTAAGKAAGKRNKYDYVKKILESDYEAMTSGGLKSVPGGAGRSSGAGARERYYAETRAHAEAEAESHRQEVYRKLPSIEHIDKEIARLNRESVSAIMSRSESGRKESARIAAEIERKLAQKTDAMRRAGFPTEYMEIQYHCATCHDTGVKADGGACDCFAPR